MNIEKIGIELNVSESRKLAHLLEVAEPGRIISVGDNFIIKIEE